MAAAAERIVLAAVVAAKTVLAAAAGVAFAAAGVAGSAAGAVEDSGGSLRQTYNLPRAGQCGFVLVLITRFLEKL